ASEIAAPRRLLTINLSPVAKESFHEAFPLSAGRGAVPWQPVGGLAPGQRAGPGQETPGRRLCRATRWPQRKGGPPPQGRRSRGRSPASLPEERYEGTAALSGDAYHAGRDIRPGRRAAGGQGRGRGGAHSAETPAESGPGA